ncbi:hypothetical protein AKJ59_00530, partial [candidate division MSBL1 archaeon SCGC-AAA385M02]
EPLSALDAPTQDRMRSELKRIHHETGVTTIHVTHNREEASLLADRIGVMSNGRIVQIGGAEEIFRKPESEFVADFTGAENIFDGNSKVENGIARVDIGESVKIVAVSKKEGDVKACIRPEYILVSKHSINTSGRNMFEGEISGILDQGPTVKLKIDVGRKFTVVITKKSLMDMELETGSRVFLAFKASAVHLI